MAGILLAGFGGQGILFAGKQLTKAGMEAGKNVSWLPSYGPEMRGGTCNCSVNIDDKPIGSPLVTAPGHPHRDESAVAGQIRAQGRARRVRVCRLVAGPQDLRADGHPRLLHTGHQAGRRGGLKGLANVIMLGKVIRETGIFDYEFFRGELLASAPKSKPQLGELNAQALKIGYDG